MTETEIQKQFVDVLRKADWTVLRVNSGLVKVRNGWAHLAPKGTPDLLAIRPDSSHVWIEVKKPEGKLSPEQTEWIDKHRARGVEVHVFDTLDDLCAVLLSSDR
jgi:Holliday junction resolvase